jgi:hypothetical protein
MVRTSRGRATVAAAIAAGLAVLVESSVEPSAQGGLAFRQPLDHPAIRYSTSPPADPVSILNRNIESGAVRLRFDPSSGYLTSVLAR